MNATRLVRPLGPVLLFAVAAAQGSVHVVDLAGGPGADFTSLSAAVAAAAGGDVLLVRSGVYDEPILLAAKSLVIVADIGASVQAERTRIDDLAADDAVTVRGLSLSTTDDFSGRVSDSAGPVWFEDTTFLGVPVPPGQTSASGFLRVVASDAVVVARCELTRPFLSASFATLSVLGGSRVHVHDSSVVSKPGDAAIAIGDSFLELFGSSAVGADGSDGISFPFCTAEDGGDGLALSGASLAVLLDSLLGGGMGGMPCGTDGQPLIVNGGSTTSLAGAAVGYEVSSPVRDDETIQATITGAPGDPAWIFFSSRPGPGVSAPFLDGELLLGSPLRYFFAGVVPASGALTVSVTPSLPPGVESQVLYTQPLVVSSATGRFQIGSPSVLVLLDAQF